MLALCGGPLAAGAQDGVGLMYANAQGGEKDDAQAVAWLRRAADQGMPARSSIWR
ncbi:SEL1-like repeat protein [Achromobacter xylosoxidans]